MDDYEKRRKERRAYEADVYYEVWRAGGDPDRISDDRLDDARWDGVEPETAARSELRAQQPTPPEPNPEDQYEEGVGL